jgi:hypothetical protein
MQFICQHDIQFGTKLNVNTDTPENLLKLVPILKSLSQSKAWLACKYYSAPKLPKVALKHTSTASLLYELQF